MGNVEVELGSVVETTHRNALCTGEVLDIIDVRHRGVTNTTYKVKLNNGDIIFRDKLQLILLKALA